MSRKAKKNPSKTSKSRIVVEIMIYLVLIVTAVYIVPNYVLQRTVVDGYSMENTLHDKESLLVEKVTKYFTDPKRYDIIVFDPPASAKDGGDDYFIKRIIGLPGETIQIQGDAIYINGEAIEDGYGKMPMDEDDNMTVKVPYQLSEDEFFVLGDNRAGSKDSRDDVLGPIKRDMIIGSAVLRVWPLNKFGVPD